MTSSGRRVVVQPDKAALAEHVSSAFVGLLARLTQEGRPVHISLTGGSMGIAVLAATAAHPGRDIIDWTRVHLWWSDERFLPRDDPERNVGQARAAMIDATPIPAENVHEPWATEDGELDAAARSYADELDRCAPAPDAPRFDLCFLGVGPDGHIASLFPDRDEVRLSGRSVVPVRDSPKPPPERISFTRELINASERVWLVIAGADKAAALGLVMAGAEYSSVPAAGAYGLSETIVFADQDATTNVPEDLIDPDW